MIDWCCESRFDESIRRLIVCQFVLPRTDLRYRCTIKDRGVGMRPSIVFERLDYDAHGNVVWVEYGDADKCLSPSEREIILAQMASGAALVEIYERPVDRYA